MLVDQERRQRPLVFVDDLAQPVLAPGDLQHFQKSLRLRFGDPIGVGDGRGRWMPARLGEVAEPEGPIHTEAPPVVAVGVAFAPVKAERPDFVVQKLVELGVDRIVVVTTDRSVVKWDDTRAGKQFERWQNVVTEACMQSRRLHRPTIEGPTPLRHLAADGYDVVLAEPGAPRLGLDPHRGSGSAEETPSMLVCVGPEGGWSAAELAAYDHVGLPGNILRAETAAIAAGVLLVASRPV
ncbi:MAG: RsmE family RNA methyltransferase [Acidimicrobiales bacterium]